MRIMQTENVVKQLEHVKTWHIQSDIAGKIRISSGEAIRFLNDKYVVLEVDSYELERVEEVLLLPIPPTWHCRFCLADSNFDCLENVAVVLNNSSFYHAYSMTIVDAHRGLYKRLPARIQEFIEANQEVT